MRQLFISIELVSCKPKVGYLKLLQKVLNGSKIGQVLPTKFSPLVVKIADNKQLSGVEIMETSQSFDRRNVCSSIILHSSNIGL